MRNIKLTLEYDGTDYGGWQRQKSPVTPEGPRTTSLRGRQAYGAGSQQQKKIVESRTEQRNLHSGRIGPQEISVDKIEVKKKQQPRKKSQVSREKVLSERKKKKVAIEQKRQEKILQEKNLISYYQLISEQIKQKAIYPERARRNLGQGLVYISFTVLSNGHLKEIELKISSGNDYLDKAALQSVQEAVPFPPFPPQLKEKQLCLNIPISFEIE